MKNNAASIGLFLAAAALLAGSVFAGWKANNLNTEQAVRNVDRTLVELMPNEDLFDVASSSNKPVVVDFYADWCGPCKMQSGLLHEIAEKLDGDHPRIVKVNVDKHPELARQFQVTSIPALFVIEDGEVVDGQIGVAKAGKIQGWLK